MESEAESVLVYLAVVAEIVADAFYQRFFISTLCRGANASPFLAACFSVPEVTFRAGVGGEYLITFGEVGGLMGEVFCLTAQTDDAWPYELVAACHGVFTERYLLECKAHVECVFLSVEFAIFDRESEVLQSQWFDSRKVPVFKQDSRCARVADVDDHLYADVADVTIANKAEFWKGEVFGEVFDDEEICGEEGVFVFTLFGVNAYVLYLRDAMHKVHKIASYP